MKAVALPRVSSDLTEIDQPLRKLRHDATLLAVNIHDKQLVGLKARGLTLNESLLNKVSLTEANLEKLGLLDTVIDYSEFIATNCAESSWQRVQLKNVRASGLKLQISTLRDVAFEDCKLDLTNFRFAKLKNVIFKSCVLDETDFYNAELQNVQFQSCSLHKAEFSSVKCKNVDLRTSDLSEISGIEGLAGTTIDSVQLVALAPIIARTFNISISDE